jgi:hypothetical protein
MIGGVLAGAMALFVLFVGFAIRRKRTRWIRRPGAGAAGAVYDLLNEDKRKAIEIIVEERAEARDPEDADGNLPDLEDPIPRRSASPRADRRNLH